MSEFTTSDPLMAEARVVAVLAAKLEALIQEAQSGEDVPSANQ